MIPHQRVVLSPEPTPGCSQPLHVKRIEKALDMQLFLNQFTSAGTAADADLNADDESLDMSDDGTVKLDILVNGKLTAVSSRVV